VQNSNRVCALRAGNASETLLMKINSLKFNDLSYNFSACANPVRNRKPQVFRQIRRPNGYNTRFNARAIAATDLKKSPSPFVADSQFASSINAACRKSDTQGPRKHDRG
jgi:hypothetical protein